MHSSRRCSVVSVFFFFYWLYIVYTLFGEVCSFPIRSVLWSIGSRSSSGPCDARTGRSNTQVDTFSLREFVCFALHTHRSSKYSRLPRFFFFFVFYRPFDRAFFRFISFFFFRYFSLHTFSRSGYSGSREWFHFRAIADNNGRLTSAWKSVSAKITISISRCSEKC